MPAWLERIEAGMRRGGVREPFALMNSIGIKHGSKTVVGKKEAEEKMRSHGRKKGKGRKRREVNAHEAGDAMAQRYKSGGY